METQGHYPPPPPAFGRANIFTDLATPYFNIIDDGTLYRKPFVVLYMILAGLNLLGILGTLYLMFKGNVASIFIGLFVIFGLWVGFQLWWNRRDRINRFSAPGSEFVALPVFSHFFQTCGEWMGTMVAIVGTGGSIVGALFGTAARSYENPFVFAAMADPPLIGIIAAPIAGFLILILSRAIAEQIRALVAVANNTRSIDINTRDR